MAIERMDHVGIVVDDLAAAIAFFKALGLELLGEASVEGEWADRVIGLEGTRSDIAMLGTPDGNARIELSKFHSPPMLGAGRVEPTNTAGLRHLSFLVDDVDATLADLREHGVELVGDVVRYDDVFRLCHVRGPEGIIVELAERLD
jgi:catechol 2,3-dioxygenase-like lactoylglutathione lyase family enzyme